MKTQDEMRAEFEAWFEKREVWPALTYEEVFVAGMQALSEQYALDAARLDALEEIARKSSTGVSIDFVRFVEEGHVLEHGYRVLRRGMLYERKKTIRSAIDAAIAAQGEMK